MMGQGQLHPGHFTAGWSGWLAGALTFIGATSCRCAARLPMGASSSRGPTTTTAQEAALQANTNTTNTNQVKHSLEGQELLEAQNG